MKINLSPNQIRFIILCAHRLQMYSSMLHNTEFDKFLRLFFLSKFMTIFAARLLLFALGCFYLRCTVSLWKGLRKTTHIFVCPRRTLVIKYNYVCVATPPHDQFQIAKIDSLIFACCSSFLILVNNCIQVKLNTTSHI
jgi:hypothetical protein